MKFFILLYFTIVAAASLAIIFIKRGISSLGELDIAWGNLFPSIWKILTNFQVLTGIFFYGVLAISYFILLSKIHLNIAASLITGSVYVAVILVAIFYFKENIPLLSWLGIGLICLGMYLISRHLL